MRDPADRSTTESRASRTADAGFGAFFLALGVAIFATRDPAAALGALIAAIVVGGLGVEALVAAARGRRSLLSRIGPLP
jgi:hypothetical protein